MRGARAARGDRYRHDAIEFLGGNYTSAGFSTSTCTCSRKAGPEPEAIPRRHRARGRRSPTAGGGRAGRVRDAKTALALLLADARMVAG